MFGYQSGGQRLPYWHIVNNLLRKWRMLRWPSFRRLHLLVPRKRVCPTRSRRFARQNPDCTNLLCLGSVMFEPAWWYLLHGIFHLLLAQLGRDSSHLLHSRTQRRIVNQKLCPYFLTVYIFREEKILGD